MQTLDATIAGSVQGVGFRAFVAREARALGLCGAVWNRADGTERVRASGARAALEQLAERLAIGPRAARIRSVSLEWAEAADAPDRFEIRGSASE